MIGLMLCEDERHTLSAPCVIRDLQAVADGVVSILVELSGGVGGRDEAIERIACSERSRRVGIADDAVGGGQGRKRRCELRPELVRR